jgi:hypothetical protein
MILHSCVNRCMPALVKVKVCSCVVATQHPHKVSGCTFKEYCFEDPKKVSNKNLPTENDSRIMGLRVCEGVLSCYCHVLMMWCWVSHGTTWRRNRHFQIKIIRICIWTWWLSVLQECSVSLMLLSCENREALLHSLKMDWKWQVALE